MEHKLLKQREACRKYREKNREALNAKAREEYHSKYKDEKNKKAKETYRKKREEYLRIKYGDKAYELLQKYKTEPNKKYNKKEKVKCECGSSYSMSVKSRHLKTKKHQLYINSP